MLETPKLLLKLNDKKYLILYILLLATLLWLTLQPGLAGADPVYTGPMPDPAWKDVATIKGNDNIITVKK